MKKSLGYIAISMLLVVGTSCAKSSRNQLKAYLATVRSKRIHKVVLSSKARLILSTAQLKKMSQLIRERSAK